jgi:YHS domain-containing protein
VPADADKLKQPIDPVCEMTIDPAHVGALRRRAGIDYSFCSIGVPNRSTPTQTVVSYQNDRRDRRANTHSDIG